jgi:hypothetical protein
LSWNDIDKKIGGSGIGGRLVQFEENVPQTMRILDEEPFTTRVHKISQIVTIAGKTEEVFRTIPATQSADDSYILKNSRRYPEQQLHNIRVALYKKDANGKLTDEFEFKVLQGGPQIFKALRELWKTHGHLNQFDVTISKSGKKRDTEYLVSAAPFSRKLDVQQATAKLETEESFAWVDIAYDPAAIIAAEMPWERAQQVKFTFGKYKDKSIGDLVVVDAGYVTWAAENVHTNDEVAAACRVAVAQMQQSEVGQAPVTQQIAAPKPVKKTEPLKPAAAPKPAVSAEREKLLERANKFMNDIEDMSAGLEMVKDHGAGKTRLKDLTDAQLTSLVGAIAELQPNG